MQEFYDVIGPHWWHEQEVATQEYVVLYTYVKVVQDCLIFSLVLTELSLNDIGPHRPACRACSLYYPWKPRWPKFMMVNALKSTVTDSNPDSICLPEPQYHIWESSIWWMDIRLSCTPAFHQLVNVTLGSGRDKRGLKDSKGARNPWRVSSRDTGAGGFLSSS